MQNGRIYSFDRFQLDVDNRLLLGDEKPISLSAKAFDLLHVLLENNGRLVEKDVLFNSVWQDQIVEESNLTVHISQIRKALGENKNNPRYIETVPGYGYRFVGELRDTEDDEIVIETQTLERITIEKAELSGESIVDGRKVETLPETTDSPRRGTSTTQKVALGAFAVILVLGSIFWLSSSDQNSAAVAPADNPAQKQIQIKRLTAKGTVDYAVLSPDGKFFVYAVRERDSFQSSLWLGQTSGTSDVQLRPVGDFVYNPRSFSADGTWLYYTESVPRGFDNGTLYKIRVLGGVPQKLLNNVSVYAVLSPDESQIAFVRGNNENRTESLVISNLDGSAEREIVTLPVGQAVNNFGLSWSADGALLAFAGESGKDKDQEIFSANIADGSVKQITSLKWIGVSRIAFTRDGSGLIAVARDKSGIAANQLWRIDRETGKARQITGDLLHYGSTLSLSADSNAFVAVQAVLESNIWIAPADDFAEARQITFGSSGLEGWYGIDWTPGGNIIYTARVDQSLTLWSMDTAGRDPKQITATGFLDQRPSLTPDGKYIVFQSNRSGATEIWRADPDGTGIQQLTFDGGNTIPHSTPDGKTIVYTHGSDGINSAWRISIDGGEAAQITDAECYNARVSPDGNFIACGSPSDGKMKLAIFLIEGGAPVKLFDVPPTYNFDFSIRWTRDGGSVTYRDWANGVWSQSVDGGEPKRLEGLPAEKLYAFEWSPDGKQFAFTRGREVRDVVLITNVR
ncbi:MAG: winged helix-turn-helix domain-containing protein [Pyrinomonadaceae bacterium]